MRRVRLGWISSFALSETQVLRFAQDDKFRDRFTDTSERGAITRTKKDQGKAWQ
jgi:hypothetical protein